MVYVKRYVIEASPRRILATMPGAHGVSGGPLFDADGRLIGISEEASIPATSMQTANSSHVGLSHYAGFADLTEEIDRMVRP